MTVLHVPIYFPGLAEAFVAAMRAVRGGGAVSLPDFQHGVGDPVEDAVQLAASHRIVLVEGNYLLLGAPPPPGACALSAGGPSCGCHVVAAASPPVGDPSLAIPQQSRSTSRSVCSSLGVKRVSSHTCRHSLPEMQAIRTFSSACGRWYMTPSIRTCVRACVRACTAT